jgi:hypothetical protein
MTRHHPNHSHSDAGNSSEESQEHRGSKKKHPSASMQEDDRNGRSTQHTAFHTVGKLGGRFPKHCPSRAPKKGRLDRRAAKKITSISVQEGIRDGPSYREDDASNVDEEDDWMTESTIEDDPPGNHATNKPVRSLIQQLDLKRETTNEATSSPPQQDDQGNDIDLPDDVPDQPPSAAPAAGQENAGIKGNVQFSFTVNLGLSWGSSRA